MWNVKYYYTFKSLNEDTFKVEILTEATGTTPTEIIGAATPCTLEFPTAKKLDIIRSSGATLRLISTEMFKFLDLGTDNVQEYKVIIYKNNSVYWAGWLDSELYNENLSEYENYEVEFTASDFNVCERIKYVDDNGNNYTGISTLFDVLLRCLNKLKLTNTINISISTSSTQFEFEENETILHKLFVQNQNFYDEKNEAMNIKEVIENVLQAFGLILIQINNEFFVYDINSIKNNLQTKKYIDGVYSSTFLKNLNTVDIQGLFGSEDSTLTFDEQFNALELTSSLYADTQLFDKEVKKNDLENLISSGATQHIRYVTNKDFKYIYSNNDVFDNTKDHNYIYYNTNVSNNTLIGAKISAYSHIINKVVYNDPSVPEYEFSLPQYIISSEGKNRINIKAQIYINTKSVPLDPDINIEIYYPKIYNTANSNVAILICDLYKMDTDGNIIAYLDNISGQNANIWKTDIAAKTKHSYYLHFSPTANPLGDNANTCLDQELTNSDLFNEYNWYRSDYNSYVDTAFNKGSNIDIDGGCYLKLVIYSCAVSRPTPGNYGYWADEDNILKEILLQKLTFEIFDQYGDSLSTNDIVYNSYINKKVKNDYENVEMKICTASQSDVKIGKANILFKDINNKFQLANSFARSGQSGNLEQLLIRTIHSNYINKNYLIETDILNTDNIYLNDITYNSILPNQIFNVAGSIIDFENNTQHLTLNQLSIDNIDLSNITLTDEDGKVIDTIKTDVSTRTAKARTNNLLDSMSGGGGSTTIISGGGSELTLIDGGTW